jgi:hypothetical protein
VEQVLTGVGTSGREGRDEERAWEGEYGANTVHMYVNGKMIPVETIPGIGGDGGERWRVWIQVWYIVRTFSNAIMYPHLVLQQQQQNVQKE